MKPKTTIILKSLTDLPADSFTSTTSTPGRVVRAPGPAGASPGTGDRLRSLEFLNPLTARNLASLPALEPWPHGGLNE